MKVSQAALRRASALLRGQRLTLTTTTPAATTKTTAGKRSGKGATTASS